MSVRRAVAAALLLAAAVSPGRIQPAAATVTPAVHVTAAQAARPRFRAEVVLANVNQFMAASKIRADVAKIFALMPDVIVFNEAKPSGHAEMRAQAKKRGYLLRVPKGPLHEVTIAWKISRWQGIGGGATTFTKGMAKVTPARGLVRQVLQRAGSPNVVVFGTHFPARAWTHPKPSVRSFLRTQWDRLRDALVSRVKARAARVAAPIVIWAGDVNRPDSRWPNRRPFPALRNVKGYATAVLPHPGPTLGKARFDMVGVLSKNTRVTVKSARTVRLHSDHRAVLLDLAW
ncbi:MAG: hypothetical protein FWG11_08685 [Promicromonosporaceae bacterium]|nr:hypothetical protein [Promicromonosporaceae bacterium]